MMVLVLSNIQNLLLITNTYTQRDESITTRLDMSFTVLPALDMMLDALWKT